MTLKRTVGRPRKAIQWSTELSIRFDVHFGVDRDVHTLVYLTGADIKSVVINALRQYIQNQSHEAGDPEVQSRIAMEGLGLASAHVKNKSEQANPQLSKQIRANPSRGHEQAGNALKPIRAHEQSEQSGQPELDTTTQRTDIDCGTLDLANRWLQGG